MPGEAGEPVGPGVVTGAEEDDLSDAGRLVLDEVIDQPGAGDRRGARPGSANEVIGGFDSRPHAAEARDAECSPPWQREERGGQRVDEEARAGRPRRLEPALDRHERGGTAGPAPAGLDEGRACPIVITRVGQVGRHKYTCYTNLSGQAAAYRP